MRLVAAATVLALSIAVACEEAPQQETERIHAANEHAIPTPDPPPNEWRVVEAIAEARDVVASEPESAEAWGSLGMVFDAHRYLPEATQCYRRALQLAPDDFRWNYHLAITLNEEAGDVEEVVRLFEKASRAEPRYPPVPFQLGEALQRHGRYTEARDAFERTLELDPELAIARRQLALVLLALDEPELALSELERALALDPSDGGIHAALARAYARLGQPERARAAADAAGRNAPEIGVPDPVRFAVASLGVSGALAFKRGRAALEAGQIDEAIALFEIKDEVNSSDFNYYFLGLAHKRAGRIDEAIRHFDKAVQMSGHADSHLELGQLMLERGDKMTGLEHLRQARTAAKMDPGLLQSVGTTLARHGEHLAAIEIFADAGRLDATNSSLEADWCAALLELGRVEEGLSHCENAVRFDDSSPRAHLHLGIALEMADRVADARHHYERAVELDPESRARERLGKNSP